VIAVEYPPERRGLPPALYDSYLALEGSQEDEGTLRQAFIDFLTAKSPRWEYEQEVRMIYDLEAFLKSPSYRRITLACTKCQARDKSPEECTQALYRDALDLPSNAILGVIFGADCPYLGVERILKILSQENFKHTQT
jgi:hypothetical protein